MAASEWTRRPSRCSVASASGLDPKRAVFPTVCPKVAPCVEKQPAPSPREADHQLVQHLDLVLPLIHSMLDCPHLSAAVEMSCQTTEPALKLLRHLLVGRVESGVMRAVSRSLSGHGSLEEVLPPPDAEKRLGAASPEISELSQGTADASQTVIPNMASSYEVGNQWNDLGIENSETPSARLITQSTRFSVCSDSSAAAKSNLKLSCLHPSILMGSTPDIGSRRGSLNDMDAISSSRMPHRPHLDMEKVNCCYIHPERAFRLSWDLSSMGLILILMLVIPFELCFMWDAVVEDPVIYWINILSDLFFGIDVVLNCFTAFHKGKGASSRLVVKPHEIMKQYAKGWLWADLIATFPFARIAKLGGETGSGQGAGAVGMLRALKVAKIARMLKVIRVLKLGGLMQLVEEQVVTVQSMTVAFQLAKLTVIMLLISHCAACAWFAVGFWGREHFATTWLTANGLAGAGRGEQYIASFYFAITTGTTVGYGDISATNTMEQIVGSLLLICAVAYIGHFLARVGQVVSSLKQSEAEMLKAKRDAMLFMRKRHVPKGLFRKVLRYIEHIYETDSVTSLDHGVLEKLSESLQMQLALAVTGSILKKIPLFSSVDDSFVTAICRVCITRRAAAGDIVAREEQAADGMYLIARGEALILQDSAQLGVLRDEDWFGERALFVADAVHHVTIRCEADCEFLVLLREDFRQQLGQFPRIRREYNRLVEKCRSSSARDSPDCYHLNRNGVYAPPLENSATPPTLRTSQQRLCWS